MAENKYLDLNGLKYYARKLENKKANLESPVLTGTPLAPTASVGTNTTQIATTEFVGLSIDNKMDKLNPTGTGSFSLNRKADSTIGDNSFAEGSNNIASGNSSHAEGYYTQANDSYAHAEGQLTVANSISHSEGYSTVANYVSHAEGHTTTATGWVTHAEGADTTASGSYSHAEGRFTQAAGNYSHSEGYGLKCYDYKNGSDSIVISLNESTVITIDGTSDSFTQDISNYLIYLENSSDGTSQDDLKVSSISNSGSSLVITLAAATTLAAIDFVEIKVYQDNAYGFASHSEGLSTSSIGIATHAEGKGTIAGTVEAQHVEGRYNIRDNSTYAHILGNGTSENSRSNAHTIDWNGNVWFAGDLYLGGTSQSTGTKAEFKDVTDWTLRDSQATYNVDGDALFSYTDTVFETPTLWGTVALDDINNYYLDLSIDVSTLTGTDTVDLFCFGTDYTHNDDNYVSRMVLCYNPSTKYAVFWETQKDGRGDNYDSTEIVGNELNLYIDFNKIRNNNGGLTLNGEEMADIANRLYWMFADYNETPWQFASSPSKTTQAITYNSVSLHKAGSSGMSPIATEFYVSKKLQSKANSKNAILTGTPTAPTADTGTDTTQIATTAFVQDALILRSPNGSKYKLSVADDGTLSAVLVTE